MLPRKLLPSTHAIERAYRVVNALCGSGVPVLQMHCLCDDTALIGSANRVWSRCSTGNFPHSATRWQPSLTTRSPGKPKPAPSAAWQRVREFGQTPN